ncbi:NAD-dependent epimerase/dehydratase family protein [Myroides odoratimimus]|uniref:NAD-dependent epimerase/dehydratase family protein n=1 Tax=Myroides odoratimimus TaxID=76832 RepID=UPI0025778D44|nr:NAD(P)-dependent oxidoreductase [Myroides odoratimimus]MDM1094754.1 NAD(P)-dependent oxidoreductase [Myroides odoratimimus]
MKKVVVFGATGNLGAYTSVHLKNLGYDVHAVGFRKSDNDFFKLNGMTYYSVDISKKEDFDILPKDIYGIVHLAGELPSRYEYKPELLVSSITLGTLNVLEYMLKAGGKRIVFPQTPFDQSEYHNTNNVIPADEPKTFPLLGDHSVYTIAKNAAVDLIDHYAATYSFKRFHLRFFTIYHYHPNAYHFSDYKRRMMPYRMLMDRASKSLEIEVWGDVSRSKEMVYVKDFTQVIEKCFSCDAPGGMYNVGGKAVSLEEQISGIIDVFSPEGNKSKKIYKPEMPNPLMAKFDISKTEQELGFKQQYSYLDSLVDFKKDMEEEPFALLWGVKEDYTE